jgi:LuxR family maltose regulon positive regulatory protein
VAENTDARADSVVTAAGEPLMAAKFGVEPGPADVVVRPRVHDRLTAGIRGSLTLVAAPAGSGKTTAVASWAAAGLPRGTLTWITLDAGDRQPGVFWSYVLAGLARTGVQVSTVDSPERADQVDQSFLVRLSAALYGRSEPVVLVLDDAHLLAGGPILHQLDFLVRHAGTQLAVVLIARSSAGLGLHRHRLAGTLTEIGSAELAFTAEEATALLRVRGITVTDAVLHGLLSRTRGWAVGLALAAIALRDQCDRTPAAPGPDSADLADFFLAEVLDGQPAGLRRFMLRTSIVEHLQPGLADRLTGRRDSADTLAALVRANSFLEVCPSHPDCYRYHPLFADVLRAQLGPEDSAAVLRLHHLAAAWFAAAGSVPEAVRHMAAGCDWTAAAGLVVDEFALAGLLAAPAPDGPFGALADMPADSAGPEPAVVRAALEIGQGDLDAAAGSLARANALAGNAPAERAPALELAIGLVGLVLALARADLDAALLAAAAAQTALDGLAGAGVDVPAEMCALVLLTSGGAQFAAGRMETAAATLGDGVRAAHGADGDAVRMVCLGRLALVEAVRGHLVQATELARTASTLADRRGLPAMDRAPAADLALAWIHAESGESATARIHLDRAAATVGIGTDPTAAALAALVRSRLLRTAGDLDGALAAIGQAPPSLRGGSGWIQYRLRAAAAAVQIAAGRPDEAIRSIRGQLGSGSAVITLELARAELARGDVAGAAATTTELLSRPDLSVGVRVEGWLLQASCGLELGERPAARSALDRALRLAEPERLRRPVLDAPPRLRRFLRHDTGLAARHAWLGGRTPVAPTVRTVRTVVPAPAPGPAAGASAPVIVEALTEKEREVLGYLAALLSTEEIAGAMFVSVNTVKTHVRNILRKLAASRRNEAIRRARDLQLI